MKTILLVTKRRWNWKVFLLLASLIIPAQFAILPFEFSRQQAYGADSTAAIGWDVLLLDRLINIVIVIMAGGIGLLLANRIGLGLPFAESWLRHERLPVRFRNIVAIAWITAFGMVLLTWLTQTAVFGPPLNAMYAQLGISIPQGAPAPPLHGLLASFSAGITEETLYRLFGLSLLAWLLGLLFHDADGRPNAIAFWAGNILFALAFAAGHLPTAASLGLPMNALVISATLFGNGIAGLTFGWLYWRYGLESAMLGHFFADVIVYALVPLATLQAAGTTARTAATAGVTAFMLIALFWAGRALISGSAARQPQVGD